VQKIDENFLIGLRSCRRLHEFKWSTMDPSDLMKSKYWSSMEMLLSSSWERIVSQHIRNVETYCCETIREVRKSLSDTFEL
jgi:hypothetical protein